MTARLTPIGRSVACSAVAVTIAAAAACARGGDTAASTDSAGVARATGAPSQVAGTRIGVPRTTPAGEWSKTMSRRRGQNHCHKLRHLDTDASWSKSGYHGWVYGYGLHFVDNRVGFPKWVQIETAAVAESDVIDQQAVPLIQHFRPETVTTDNSYAKARRIRQWAPQGVVLLSPAVKWVKGRYALAYHRYIQQPENAELLRRRRTAIEPVFDLIAQVLGTKAKQKQLPIQKLSNVRTCLALATLTVQVAMIANSIWDCRCAISQRWPQPSPEALCTPLS